MGEYTTGPCPVGFCLWIDSENGVAAVSVVGSPQGIARRVGSPGWLYLELLLVLLMLMVQFRLYQRIRTLEEAPLDATRREFSMMLGLVSLLLLETLMLVFLKPF
jgi:uncharacterized membrane protein